MLIIDLVIGTLSSFIGSMIALALWMHYDLEGLWEQRRLARGKELDDRQRKAAEQHGKR